MKLYYRILLSYLCVCLIPLSLSLFTIAKLEKNVQQTILEDHEGIVETIRQSIDQRIENVSNTISILSQATSIDDLGKKSEFTIEDMLESCKLVSSLGTVSNQQDALSSYFCYFFKSGKLVSNNRTYSREVLDLFALRMNFDLDVLLDAFDQQKYISGIQIVYDRSGVPYALVLQNQYSDDYKEKQSCIGQLLNLSSILNIWDGDTSEVFLMDRDGSFIYGSENVEQAVLEMENPEVNGEVTLDGKRYLYFVYPSAVSELTYGFLTDREVYYEGIYALREQMVIELVAYFLIGVLFSVLWSRKTWSPFQNIVEFMHKHGEKDIEISSVESLTRAISNFAGEKESLENRLYLEREQKRSQYIGRYLTGLSRDSSILSQYIEDGQIYHLLMFCIIHPENSEFFQNVPQEKYMETMDMLYFAVCNILEEVLLETRNGVCIRMENSIVMIVQDEDGIELQTAEINRAIELTEKALNLKVLGYVSPAYDQLIYAPQGWELVQRAHHGDEFWQKDLNNSTKVVQLEPQQEGYGGFINRLEQFSGYLDNKNLERAKDCLTQILQCDLVETGLPYELVHSRFNLLVELMAIQLPEKERNVVVRQMLRQTSMDKMSRELKKCFEMLCGQETEEIPVDKGDQLAYNVQTYVRENYQNAALNASMIADYLHMNLSTLSRRYKNVAGHGVLDEIHLVRLSFAKELLKGGLTVRETAEKVGYLETRSMVRAFKRYEGITPSEYQEKNKTEK